MSVFRVILVRIFSHSDWIWRDTPILWLFSPNAGKCRPEYLGKRTLFTRCVLTDVWDFSHFYPRIQIYPLQLNKAAGVLEHSRRVKFSASYALVLPGYQTVSDQRFYQVLWNTTSKLQYKSTRKIITNYDTVFLSNRKLEWLQLTCLKRSCDLPKDVFTAITQ